MRFLADENFPANAVKELKAAGHDVIWVRTAIPTTLAIAGSIASP